MERTKAAILSDVCECGDYRSQHYRVGFHSKEACAICRCNVFRLWREANVEELAAWVQYHAKRPENQQHASKEVSK